MGSDILHIHTRTCQHTQALAHIYVCVLCVYKHTHIIITNQISSYITFTACAGRDCAFHKATVAEDVRTVNINTIYMQWPNSSKLQGQERFFVRCFLASDRFLKKIIRFVKLRPACVPIDHGANSGLPWGLCWLQTENQLGRKRENKVLLSLVIFQLLLCLADALFSSEQRNMSELDVTVTNLWSVMSPCSHKACHQKC